MEDAMPETTRQAVPLQQGTLPVFQSAAEMPGGDTLAQLLVARQLITEEQLVYAKRVRSKLVSEKSIIGVLKELRLLTNAQLTEVLKQQRLNIRIGDLLVELGHIRQGELEAALAIQLENRHQKLGDILVEYGSHST